VVSDEDESMDANSGRALAQRLAQSAHGPLPPIRGTQQQTGAAPIFRWFAVEPPADDVEPAEAA
jgi:hypothetical protein